MAVLEEQRTLAAEPGLAWDVVADLAGEAGPPPFVRRIELLGGDGAGSRRKLVGSDHGVWEEECTEWEPGRRFALRVVSGDFPVQVAAIRYTCVIEPAEGQTRVRVYFDYQPRFGVFGRLLDGFTTRRQLGALARELMNHWVRLMHIREWAHRVTAASLLEEKGRQIFSVAPDTLIADAVDELREQGIGSVLVLDAEQNIAGVLSERDIVRGLAMTGGSLLNAPVSSIMTRDVITASPNDNMMMVMTCMSNSRIRHLPVVEAGNALGIISIGDVVKARISELEGRSETLRDFIEARRWHELYREVGPAAYSTDWQDRD